MASGLITSWQIYGEKVETVTDFIFLGSKIIEDSDCSHEIKRHLLLGKKAMTNLDSILKSRDITLPTKDHIVKAMVFPVVMYGCESWTITKAECRRIDAFELWYWRRLLRVPWTARSNQSILKEINPAYSLEGLMLKLKLQYFGHLMWRADSLAKTLMLGMIEGKRRRGWQRIRWLDGITVSVDMNLSKLREIVKDKEAWRAAVHWVTKNQTQLSQTWLSDWTTTLPLCDVVRINQAEYTKYFLLNAKYMLETFFYIIKYFTHWKIPSLTPFILITISCFDFHIHSVQNYLLLSKYPYTYPSFKPSMNMSFYFWTCYLEEIYMWDSGNWDRPKGIPKQP